MKLFVPSLDDTPKNRTPKGTVIWVIAFADDLLRIEFDLPDIWRARPPLPGDQRGRLSVAQLIVDNLRNLSGLISTP
jgi:hypothetical protein